MVKKRASSKRHNANGNCGANLNVKLSHDEYNSITKTAELYAGGNVSAWVRYTALNYVPENGELDNLDSRLR